MLEMKLMDSLAQVDPEILLIEHAKASSRALQKAEAIVVKGCRMNRFAQKRANLGAHLRGGGHRIGESKHFLRFGVPRFDEVRDPMNQNRCLACACARDYQHWSVNMLDRLPLLLVGVERPGIRLR